MEDDEDRLDLLADLDPAAAITDRPLMIRSLIVLGLTLVGFLLHSVAAPRGGDDRAARRDGADDRRPARSARGAARHRVADALLLRRAVHARRGGRPRRDRRPASPRRLPTPAGGSAPVATLGILWFSALASAIVDNIPYTATAIPIVQRAHPERPAGGPLWWSLALGACLGGNLTIVGASANIVVANLAARDGHPITFMQFFRYGFADRRRVGDLDRLPVRPVLVGEATANRSAAGGWTGATRCPRDSADRLMVGLFPASF